MLNVEEAVYDTYLKNKNYLQEHHFELFSMLELFEKSLESGNYIAEYELEYKDNYFEIIKLNSNQPLYGSNSLALSQKIVENVNFTKNSYAFECVPVTKYKKELLSELKSLNGHAYLSAYYNTLGADIGTMDEVEKFILVGVGLGIHIPFLHNKLYPKSYMIIENSFEIFRLSMFTTKYYELAIAAELHFSIASSQEDFNTEFSHFLEEGYFYNRYIKYYKFPYHTDDTLVEIKKIIISQDFVVYPYRPSLEKILRPLEYMNSGFKSLDVFNKHFVNSSISEKPFLVLAAGPSFLKNIEWLKENHQKFIIIAVSAVLPTLYKYDIKPDILTHVDASDITLKFYDGIKKEFFEKTLCVFASQVSQKLRDMFEKERVFLLEDQHSYIDKIGVLSAPCVGSSSVVLALSFYVKNLYLLGVDLAFDQETGSTHNSDHKYAKKVNFKEGTKEKYHMTMDEEILELEGNFREKVYTNPRLEFSARILNTLIPRLTTEVQNVYNLSEGVGLKGTQALHLEEIEPSGVNLKKKEVFDELFKLLSDNSISELSEEDIQSVVARIEFAKEIKNILHAYSMRAIPVDEKQYLIELLGVMQKIMPLEVNSINRSITSIYDDFSKIMLPIIFDIFNTKEIINRSEHIKEVDAIMQKEMMSIITRYLEKLEEFTQK